MSLDTITSEELLQRETSKYPLISIITVVYNGEKTLEKCIRSVINQSYKNIEYIIIDGNSSDRSLDLINKYADRIHYWVSEKDSGIYDAMNKAINIAKGDWLYFLGSDDYLFAPDTISSIFPTQDSPEYSLIMGNVIDDQGNMFSSNISWKTNLFNTVHHQSAFYRKKLFNEFRYSLESKVVADYELNYIIALKCFDFKKLSQTVAICSTSGLSKNSSEFINIADYYKIRSKHIGLAKNLCYTLLFFLNVLKRTIEKRFQ
jgi:putative colanic acid biosynthesis glycosyltransferase